jgi:beta-lactamase class A
MVVALVLAATLAQSATPNDKSKELAAIELRAGGHIGVVASTTEGKRIEYRPNERFLMCSTFKLLAAAAVLKRVDEKKDDLDRFVSYGQKDILAYAPVTKLHLAEGGMKLGDLCAAAIEQSDNTAGNLLLQTIGGPAGVTAFARTLGDKMTRLDRMEPELNVANGDSDTTTPAAMQRDLILLLTSKVLSLGARTQLEDWLSKNETGAALVRAAVPKGWRVGDKTGRSSAGATNDVAVLRPPGGEPIFLAIYCSALKGSTEERDAIVAEVTRAVINSQ